jgi:nicotinamide mononucleotide transporter
MNEYSELLIRNLQNTGVPEMVGVFFGLVSVLYARKGNVLVFPSGIISVLIYVYLCFQRRLYADMAINAYYFLMSVYGWYFWIRKTDKSEKQPITSCNRTEMINYLAVTILSFVIIYFILARFTDSDVPFIDSLTTAVFFTGMLLMARKKIENWLLWILGNTISIPLYFYKGLILTSLQFLVLLILAISGYLVWKKQFIKTDL